MSAIASELVVPIAAAVITALVSSASEVRSRRRSTLMYSRVPCHPRDASRRRRSRAKQSGRPQSASGRALSKAPGLRSSSAR